jgi:hypothetical protein
MKKLLPAFLPLVLALSAARADLTVTETIQQSGGPSVPGVPMPKELKMTVKMKGTMMRTDVSPQVSTIVNSETGDTITLMHSQKMAMTIPGAMVKNLSSKIAAALPGANSSATPSTPQPTGNKQTIDGFETEEYTATMGDNTVSFWLAPNFPDKELMEGQYAKLSTQMPQLPQFSALKSSADSIKSIGYPLRTVIVTPMTGTTTVTVEGISKDPLPDSEFQIPSDYRAMQLPQVQLPGGLLKQ